MRKHGKNAAKRTAIVEGVIGRCRVEAAMKNRGVDSFSDRHIRMMQTIDDCAADWHFMAEWMP